MIHFEGIEIHSIESIFIGIVRRYLNMSYMVFALIT